MNRNAPSLAIVVFAGPLRLAVNSLGVAAATYSASDVNDDVDAAKPGHVVLGVP